MACCHAITYIGADLIGDPLEIKMFESTGWKLEEPSEGQNSVAASALDTEIVLAKVSPKPAA